MLKGNFGISPLTQFMLGLRGEDETPETKAAREAAAAKPAFDPTTLSPEAKSYFDSQIAEQIATAVAKTAADTEARVKAEADKERKAAERKKAKEDAAAGGDAAEIARVAQEQLEADRAEAQKLREEAKADRDLVKKIAIVAKHKLPEGFESRLLGLDEKGWEADAAELAKTFARPIMVKTEGGRQGGSQSAETQRTAAVIAARRITQAI